MKHDISSWAAKTRGPLVHPVPLSPELTEMLSVEYLRACKSKPPGSVVLMVGSEAPGPKGCCGGACGQGGEGQGCDPIEPADPSEAPVIAMEATASARMPDVIASAVAANMPRYIAEAKKIRGEDRRRFVELKVKRLTDSAILPTKAHETDAGWDLYADNAVVIGPGETGMIDLGIAAEIPEGYFALIRDRSSMARKSLAVLGGVVDSEYRGSIKVVLHNSGKSEFSVEPGDKIAQALILPVPTVKVVEVKSLSDSARGEGGFGSTGMRADVGVLDAEVA